MAYHTRRNALKLIAAGSAVGIAGCLGDDDTQDDTNGDDSDPGDDEQDTYELIWGAHWPNEVVLAEHGGIYFMERVEEESDDRIQFDYHPGGELGGPTEYGELLNAGTVDIGPVSPQYDSDLFALNQAGVLPGYATHVESHSRATWELLDADDGGILYDAEWEPLDYRPLLPYGSGPMYPLLRGDPIEEISELEGLRIRSAAGVNDWTIDAIGANPEAMSAPDGYTALQQGTLDGNTAVIDGIYAFSFQEVTDYIIINAPMNHFVWVDTIRADAWNQLPEDLQNVMRDVAEETKEHWLEEQQAFNEATLDNLEEDMDFHELGEDQANTWLELMDGVTDVYLDFVDDPDTGQEAIDTFESVAAEYE